MAREARKAKTTTRLTQKAYARPRGVHVSTINQAVHEGRIRTINGTIDPAEADATWYRRYLQRHDGMRSGAESEARREQALTQSTAVKVIMTKKRAAVLGGLLVERDSQQAEISRAAAEASAALGGADDIEAAIVTAIAVDLGDSQAEALKVTQ